MAKRDPLLPVDDHARLLGRRLLRCADTATLATLADSGGEDSALAAVVPTGSVGTPAGPFPFASLVTVATAYDGAPLLLLSQLSVHTKALQADPRCSLLLRQTSDGTSGAGDPLAQPRLSLVGQAERLDREHPQRGAMLQRFVDRHPRASLYAAFPDFDVYRIEISGALLNGGFARAYRLGHDDLISTPQADLSGFAQTAPQLIQHLNSERQEEIRLLARERCGETTSTSVWRVVGLDPHGIDLKADSRSIRFEFDPPAAAATSLAARVEAILTQARERGD